MKLNRLSRGLAAGLILSGMLTPVMADEADKQQIERGRYLAITAGCNDCHTDGYMPTAGQIPESQWFKGSAVGFQGPWGTSYPSNLRLLVDNLNQEQWLERTRQPMRPPMPWFNLQTMTEQDLLALYQYLRHLGPDGEMAPAAVAPGIEVNTPYFDFTPKNLPAMAQK